MSLARRHRLALCDTAADLGPDAPTLCGSWTSRDLLAHLVVRERRPDALPGIALPVFAGHSERVRTAAADTAYDELLHRVRTGPPRWMPTSVRRLDDLVNGPEFLVHHEDLRRGTPGWAPRQLDPESTEAAWRTVQAMGRRLYRSSPVGVVLVAPGHGRSLVRRPPAGARSVVLTGAPLELLLHAFGRVGATLAAVDGRPADVEALAGSERAV